MEQVASVDVKLEPGTQFCRGRRAGSVRFSPCIAPSFASPSIGSIMTPLSAGPSPIFNFPSAHLTSLFSAGGPPSNSSGTQNHPGAPASAAPVAPPGLPQRRKREVVDEEWEQDETHHQHQRSGSRSKTSSGRSSANGGQQPVHQQQQQAETTSTHSNRNSPFGSSAGLAAASGWGSSMPVGAAAAGAAAEAGGGGVALDRKMGHNLSESKRREKINRCIEEIRGLLPAGEQTVDKSSILAAAVERVKQLQEENGRLHVTVGQKQQRNAAIKNGRGRERGGE